MADVYISCHHPDPANDLAAQLEAAGHAVISTWHRSNASRPADGDRSAWAHNANRNLELIETADVLVVIASAAHLSREKCVPGGKFVEAGYALNQKNEDGDSTCRVFTLGGVENGMLHAHGISHVGTVIELLASLK